MPSSGRHDHFNFRHYGAELTTTTRERGLDVVVAGDGHLDGRRGPGTRTGGTAVCAAPDVSDAIVSALVRGRAGERYVLGGPNLTIADLAATTLKLAGQANKWTLAVPTPVIRAAVRASLALSLPPPIEPGVLDFAVLYWFADSSKAEAELGYRTRAAEDILKPAVDWLRAANHIK